MQRMWARCAALLAVVAMVAAVPAQVAFAEAEGVVVHGAWTIDVVNPDGTLASHQTFENSLTFQGGNMLALLLSRTHTLKLWSVTLDNVVGYQSQNTPCGNTACWLLEPGSANTGDSTYIKSLDVSIGSYPSIQPLVLKGSMTAAVDEQINQVGSWIDSCGTSGPCYEGYADFTSRTLDAPVAVSEGQQVQVTVNISFS